MTLVWIDLETTGLNPYTDKIMEIAVIITTIELTEVARAEWVVYLDKNDLEFMDPWCVEQHGKSGLTKRSLESKLGLVEIEQKVLEFLSGHVPKGQGVLCGNSVHFDKEFLRSSMVCVLEYLHFRIIDVSTVRKLIKNWCPENLDNAPIKTYSHTAMSDIQESIEELRWYWSEVFKKASKA